MGLNIQKGSVKEQLASANSALSEALSSCAAAKTAIDSYQSNSNLQGVSYDSMREQYDRHLILLDGMISYMDDMLDGNRSYECSMNSILHELTYYDEDDLKQQLNRIRMQMRRIEDRFSGLMSILRAMERRVMRLLESLYQFEGSTGNLYVGAQNTWNLLRTAMNQMEQIQFDAASGVFVIPVSCDLSPFGELDYYNRKKKATGYKCIKVTADGAAVRGLSNCCLFGGDPINLSTGNFIYKKEDLKIPGATVLSFARFYNSQAWIGRRAGDISVWI